MSIENLSPGTLTFLAGLWAMVAIAIVPFAWGWDDAPDWAGGGQAKFDGGVIYVAAVWPMLPIAFVCLPVFLAVGFLLIGVPHYVAKWWNGSWA